MTIREGFSPFSGTICEIVSSLGLGNFSICQEKVRGVQKPLAVETMSNMFILLSLNACC